MTAPDVAAPDDPRAALVAGLVCDTALLSAADAELAPALTALREGRDSRRADLTGPLVVAADAAAALLEAVGPEDDVAVVLASVGPGAGLASVTNARDVLLDQPWLRPVGAWLDLVPQHLAAAASLTLDALDLTVPCTLFVPDHAAGHEHPGESEVLAALDVLAEDGAEQAGWHLGDDDRALGTVAAFLVACHERRLHTVVTADAARLPGLLAGSACAVAGGDASDVAAALRRDRVPEVDAATATATRHLLTQVGVREAAAAIDALLAQLAAPPTAD